MDYNNNSPPGYHQPSGFTQETGASSHSPFAHTTNDHQASTRSIGVQTMLTGSAVSAGSVDPTGSVSPFTPVAEAGPVNRFLPIDPELLAFDAANVNAGVPADALPAVPAVPAASIRASGSGGDSDADQEAVFACDIPGCDFASKLQTGVKEHQKNMHLGTVCYWPREDMQACNHTTETHDELLEHFHRQHLSRDGLSPEETRCCRWPGNPHLTTPDGRQIEVHPPCPHKLYTTAANADRHTRWHQHRLWCEMENPNIFALRY
ncbi:hypothetical protein F4802DRAFT_600526 [Xylaria palmicola]|nr:hypothetical protein F4802DRAFT_600526 [Xylaria palmicola]